MAKNAELLVKKGTVIFSEGDEGDCAYIIDEGRVLVYLSKDQDEIPISILGPGEIFGEMSLIDNLSRSASVRCIEDCKLSVVTREQLVQRFEKSDSLMQLLMRVLMNRLRRNNIALSNRWEQAQGKTPDMSVYVDTPAKYDDVFEKLKFENRLQEALARQEFEMFYQPILNIGSNTIIGCEALLRWNDPDRGYVMPDAFVDFLENSGLVFPVGYWILEQCFKDLPEIQKKFGPQFSMSINVSGRQFTNPNFLDELQKLAWKHRTPVKNVKLEVTERVMMDGSVALDTLFKCKNQGYSISIDDFGTGFSSLKYLSQMPVSFLKVDRSFVMKLTKDSKSLAVVRSMIFMAQSLGMEIIAEGIETQEERELLLNLGAYMGQGWLYSKALPKDKFLQLPAHFQWEKKAA